MKKNKQIWMLPLAGSFFLGAASAQADEPMALERVSPESPNRLSGSVRFGLNISGKFYNPGGSLNPNSAPGNGQHTLNGDPFNHDDGYVLPSAFTTGSFEKTWYWGVNNSLPVNQGGQFDIANSQIAFHDTKAPALPGSNSKNDSAYVGCEVTYDYELGVSNYGLEDKDGWNHFRFGIEGAGNFMPINFDTGGTYNNTTLQTTTTRYGAPGVDLGSLSLSGSQYYSHGGPGPIIDYLPGLSSTSSQSASVSTSQHFDSTLWGFRLGPYLESRVSKHFSVHLTGGLAVGILSASADWKETVTPQVGSLPSGVPAVTSGGGDDTSVLWGYYFGADAVYRFNEHWGIDLGVQYQHLDNYSHNFGGRMAELDLGHSLFLQAGISFSF